MTSPALEDYKNLIFLYFTYRDTHGTEEVNIRRRFLCLYS